jgi:MFS family permease
MTTTFSAFELSALIFSPFIGKYLDKIGRKNAIIYGDLILVITILLTEI